MSLLPFSSYLSNEGDEGDSHIQREGETEREGGRIGNTCPDE